MAAVWIAHLMWTVLCLAAETFACYSYTYRNDAVYISQCYGDTYTFHLFCYQSLTCKLVLQKGEIQKNIPELPDLDALSGNCTNKLNDFKQNSTKFPLTDDKIIVRKIEIEELEVHCFNMSRVPLDYYCPFRGLSSLIVTKVFIQDSLDFGFGGQCNQTQCCLCNLTHLNLRGNDLKVIEAASFCRLPNVDTIDLSYNEITEIHENAFIMATKLRHLDLTFNQLKKLQVDVFRPLCHLVTLHLGYNDLNEEAFLAIRQVPNLKDLSLRRNNIRNHCSSTLGPSLPSLTKPNSTHNQSSSLTDELQPFLEHQTLKAAHDCNGKVLQDIFEVTTRLEKIDLAYNHLNRLPCGMLSTNTSTTKLSPRSNPLTVTQILNSSSLNDLNLDSNQVKSITQTDRYHLCQLSNLRKLNLANNQLKTIVSNAFNCNSRNLPVIGSAKYRNESKVNDTDLNSILVLDLNENLLETFSFDYFSDDLLELYLKNNHIKVFPSDSNILVRPMALKKLVLSHNRLVNLTEVLLPPNLEQLDLQSNSIRLFSFKKTAFGDAWVIPSQLRKIDLSDNELITICPLIFWLMSEDVKVKFSSGYDFWIDNSDSDDNDGKVKLSVRHNPIACLCDTYFLKKYHNFQIKSSPNWSSDSCSVDYGIVGANNSIFVNTATPSQSDEFSCDPIPYELGCQCNLDSSYSERCGPPCPKPCKCYINKNFTMYLVNCSDQQLHNVFPLYIHWTLSWALDFSKNNINSLNSTTFLPYEKTRRLFLRRNKLTKITQDAFWKLTHLEVLDLEDNYLEELPSALFANSSRLIGLYLGRNRLTYVPADLFRPLYSIRVLHLQSNFLSNFPVWKFRELTILSTLQLSNNSWSCACEYMEQFQKWLQYSSLLVKDVDNLFCVLENGTGMSQPILTFNSSQCYETPSLFVSGRDTIVWMTVVSVMTFFIVVCVLLFLYRSEMQVLIFNRYGVRVFQHQKEVDDGKLYDAFIAYSSHDAQFVAHSLLPGLEETERPYKTCIHDRNFLAGGFITNTILEAIEHSRRTIVVLSKHFVSSGWCVFEFKSAHLKMLTDRCSRIIVILLEDMPRNIDPEIKVYLRTHTYIKWGDRLFWQKLYYALPDKE